MWELIDREYGQLRRDQREPGPQTHPHRGHLMPTPAPIRSPRRTTNVRPCHPCGAWTATRAPVPTTSTTKPGNPAMSSSDVTESDRVHHYTKTMGDHLRTLRKRKGSTRRDMVERGSANHFVADSGDLRTGHAPVPVFRLHEVCGVLGVRASAVPGGRGGAGIPGYPARCGDGQPAAPCGHIDPATRPGPPMGGVLVGGGNAAGDAVDGSLVHFIGRRVRHRSDRISRLVDHS